jgi:hypothetical protein
LTDDLDPIAESESVRALSESLDQRAIPSPHGRERNLDARSVGLADPLASVDSAVDEGQWVEDSVEVP